MTQRISLATLADTVEARGRAVRRWPGKMTPETVERIETHCHLAGRTLRMLDAYQPGLRHLLEFLRARRLDAQRRLLANPSSDETAALLSHPAVQPVLEAFPEAELAGVRPLQPERFANPHGSGAPMDAEPFAEPLNEPLNEPSEDHDPCE